MIDQIEPKFDSFFDHLIILFISVDIKLFGVKHDFQSGRDYPFEDMIKWIE